MCHLRTPTAPCIATPDGELARESRRRSIVAQRPKGPAHIPANGLIPNYCPGGDAEGFTLRAIVQRLRVINIYPRELFGIVFKETHQRSPLLQRLDALTGTNRVAEVARGAEARPAGAELERINLRLTEILQQLGVLTSAENRSRTK